MVLNGDSSESIYRRSDEAKEICLVRRKLDICVAAFIVTFGAVAGSVQNSLITLRPVMAVDEDKLQISTVRLEATAGPPMKDPFLAVAMRSVSSLL